MHDDWRELKALFLAALDRPPAERAAFLAGTSDDEPLKRRVEVLLRSHDSAGNFLEERPAGDGSPASSAMLLPSMRLGPYEIVHLLGAGGMGEVYRARDPRLEREVALKVLPGQYAADPNRVRRFEQEARAVGALNHPNVLAVFDTGTCEGRPFLVSELLEGDTLRARLAGKPLSPRKAIDYGVQIARGLAAAHGRGIVHRDLKPENVFVTHDGRVKILDFGLAKLHAPVPSESAARHHHATEAGFVLGTVGYMAPEQVRGLPADHRADIFAAGALLYELLCGHRAFEGATSADVMSAVLHHDPPPVSECVHGLSLALDRIVRRCLEKSPGERFQSASDLAFALEELPPSSDARQSDSGERRVQNLGRRASDHEGEWTSALPGPRPVAPASPQVRYAIAALVVVGIAAAAASWNSREQPEPAAVPSPAVRRIAVLPFTTVNDDPGLEYFARGLPMELTSSLAQIGGLRAIPWTFMKRVDEAMTVGDVAVRTKAEAVVEGTIQWVPDTGKGSIRVNVQMFQASTGALLWSEVFERDVGGLLRLQAEMARQIAKRFGILLARREQMLLSRFTDVPAEAVELYLRGREAWESYAENFAPAIAYFRRAIDVYPDFADAYATLASCYVLQIAYSGAAWTPEAYARAVDSANRALALNPELADAYASRGYAKAVLGWDWTGAEADFQQALLLDPQSPSVRTFYSNLLTVIGRHDDAVAEARFAEERAPLSPAVSRLVGWALFMARRYHEAVAQLEHVLTIEPGYSPARTLLARVLVMIEQGERAIDHIEPGLDGFEAIAAQVYGGASRRDEALQLLKIATRPRASGNPPFQVAVAYAAIGERDAAIAWLKRAEEEHDPGLTNAAVDPRLDFLRGDRAFEELIDRMNFKR